ncbi:hypothetical protein SVAN01_09372 [Stagonosporopsis vannaccii]|nr:hypothetical protein SVAN01_09372 [Stagonosporopsis vannaccii]
MPADQIRAFLTKILAYVASMSAQAAQVAQHIYAGDFEEVVDHHTIAKLILENQTMKDSLNNVILALELASWSGANMVMAGYRMVKHLMPPTYPVPEPNDQFKLMVAVFLPVLVLSITRNMPRAMWSVILHGYCFTELDEEDDVVMISASRLSGGGLQSASSMRDISEDRGEEKVLMGLPQMGLPGKQQESTLRYLPRTSGLQLAHRLFMLTITSPASPSSALFWADMGIDDDCKPQCLSENVKDGRAHGIVMIMNAVVGVDINGHQHCPNGTTNMQADHAKTTNDDDSDGDKDDVFSALSSISAGLSEDERRLPIGHLAALLERCYQTSPSTRRTKTPGERLRLWLWMKISISGNIQRLKMEYAASCYNKYPGSR